MTNMITAFGAKQQNTVPLIYISLNHNGAYCVILRSSKDFDTCKTGGRIWEKERLKNADLFLQAVFKSSMCKPTSDILRSAFPLANSDKVQNCSSVV